MGGMAAFIPNRRDPEVTQTRSPRCARTRSARQATASTAPGWRIPTWCRWRWRSSTGRWATVRTRTTASATTCTVAAADLLDFDVPGGEITEAGLATNVSVGIQYIASWLAGSGAAALDNLMEDAATAEISRSQVWQWVQHGRFERAEVERVLEEEVAQARRQLRRGVASSSSRSLSATTSSSS